MRLAPSVLARPAQQTRGADHQQRGIEALSGNVADDKADASVGKLEVVVEVARDLVRGQIHAEHRKLPRRRLGNSDFCSLRARSNSRFMRCCSTRSLAMRALLIASDVGAARRRSISASSALNGRPSRRLTSSMTPIGPAAVLSGAQRRLVGRRNRYSHRRRARLSHRSLRRRRSGSRSARPQDLPRPARSRGARRSCRPGRRRCGIRARASPDRAGTARHPRPA